MRGHGVINLMREFDAGPVIIESLEMTLPSSQHPLDLPTSAQNYRNRRCQLNSATLTLTETALQNWLRANLKPAALSFSNLYVHLHEYGWEIQGQVIFSDQRCDFLMHGLLLPEENRRLRFSVNDVLLFGPFPIPAPLISLGFWQACSDQLQSFPSVSLQSCNDLVFDPLVLICLFSFPQYGWRLPNLNSAKFNKIQLLPGRLNLSFGLEEAAVFNKVLLPAERKHFAARHDFQIEYRIIDEQIISGKLTEAIETYQNIEQAAEKRLFVWERLVQLLIADPHEEQRTLAAIEKLRSLDPESFIASLAQAALFVRQGEIATAAECYLKTAQSAKKLLDPQVEQLALGAAGCCLRKNNPTLARSYFEQALALEIPQANILQELSDLYEETQDWGKLVDIQRRQIPLTSSATAQETLLISLGEISFEHLKDIRQAQMHFQAALELNPTSEKALLGLLESSLADDDPQQATKYLGLISGLITPSNLSAIELRLALLEDKTGDHAKALARLERLAALHPNDSLALKHSIAILIKLTRRYEAYRLCIRLLPLIKEPTELLLLHRQMAQLAFELGNANTASEHTKQALAIDNRDFPSIMLQIRIADDIHDYKSLATALQLAAEITTEDTKRAEFLLRLGSIYATNILNITAAIAAFEKAAQCSPVVQATVRQNLEQLQELRKSREENRDRLILLTSTPAGQKDALIWQQLAQAHIELGDFSAGREVLNKALELPAPSQEVRGTLLSLLVNVQGELQDLPGKRNALEELLLVLDPEIDGEHRLPAMIELAEVRHALGDLDGTSIILSEALELSPKNLELLEEYGRLQEQRQNWNEALYAYKQVFQQIPDGPGHKRSHLALRLGRIHKQLGHFGESLDFLRRSLDGEIEIEFREKAWDLIIELHLNRNDPLAAARAAEEAAIDTTDSEMKAERFYSASLLWLERLALSEQAIRCLRLGLKCQPHHPRILDMLETLFVGQNDQNALIEILQLKLESETDHPARQLKLLTRLAETLILLNRRIEATQFYRQILTVDGENFAALIFLARDAISAPRPLEAQELYTRIIDLLSQGQGQLPAANETTSLLVESHLRLANLAARQENIAQQEHHLEQALTFDPKNQEALTELASLLETQERRGDLLEVIRRLMKIAPSTEANIAFAKKIASVLHLMPGHEDEAIKAYRDVLDLSPKHIPALEGLVQLLRQTGRLEELLDFLEQLALAIEESSVNPQKARQVWLEAAQIAQNKLQFANRANKYAAEVERLTNTSINENFDSVRSNISSSKNFDQSPNIPSTKVVLHEAGEQAILQILERNPQAPEALAPMIKLYHEHQAMEHLVETLTNIGESHPDGTLRQTALIKAAELSTQALRKPQEARALLDKALQINPDEPRVLQTLADYYLYTGELQRAEETLCELAAKGNSSAQNLERAAGLAQLRHDFLAQASYLARIVALGSEDKRIILCLAEAYKAAGKKKELADTWEKLASLTEGQERLKYYHLAAANLRELPSLKSQAVLLYQKILQEFPGDMEAAANVEQLYSTGAEQTSLIEYLQDELSRAEGEKFLELSGELATIEQELGHWTKAADIWRKALQAAPHDEKILTELIANLQKQENWESLCLLLEEHLLSGHHPPGRQVHLALILAGTYQENLSDPWAAIHWLLQAKEADPDNEQIFERLYKLYLVKEKFVEATDLLGEHIEKLPADRRASLWEELAVLQIYELNNKQAGAAAYYAAFRDNPDLQVESLTQALEIWIELGEFDRAFAAIEDAQTIVSDPSALLPCRKRLEEFQVPLPPVLSSTIPGLGEAKAQRHTHETSEGLQKVPTPVFFEEPVLKSTSEENFNFQFDSSEGITPPSVSAPDLVASSLPAQADFADSPLSDVPMMTVQDWQDLAQNYRRQANAANEPNRRAALLIEMARITEEKLAKPLEALALFEEAAATVPQSIVALRSLADATYRNQDWHRSRELFDLLWEERNKHPSLELCYRRGQIYEQLEQPEIAKQCYSQALVLAPTHRPSLEGQLRLAIASDAIVESIQTCENLLRTIGLEELDTIILLREQLGELQLRLGRFSEAREVLESVLALNSQQKKSIHHLLTIYSHLHSYKELADLLQHLISITDDRMVRASLLHYRAEILGTHLRDEEAAVDNLLMAFDLAPEYVPTLWRLVDYYWERHEWRSVDDMHKHLSKALSSLTAQPPDLRHMRLAIAKYLITTDLPQAKQLLRFCLASDDLLEIAVLDLAQITLEEPAIEKIITLLKEADVVARLLMAGKKLVISQPSAPGLSQLLLRLENAR